MNQNFDMGDMLGQLLGRQVIDEATVHVIDFKPELAEVMRDIHIRDFDGATAIKLAYRMKSGFVVGSFQEIARCNHCRQFDAKKGITMCADCFHLTCMDCIKEVDGKMLCLACESKAKLKRNLKRMVVWPYKAIVFLWKVKLAF
jgi:hypothetical protein